ncbi:gamma-aminobutyric acid type B receptor subunit 1-like [Ptychodera flava]|uniref:gamma-aminobutyric acid type B receptor subunit 1-like n=1 Tax=Ptychodera flava TaxID=63121 RepID=UPI00396A9843
MWQYTQKIFLVVIAWSGCIGNLSANKTVLYIGGLYQSVAVPGVNEEMQYGTKKALDFVNANSHILKEYELVMIENFTSIDLATMAGDALGILYDFIYEKPQLLMLIASSSSLVAQPVCEVASHYNLLQMSGSASSPGLSDRDRYPLFMRLYPSDTILVRGWEALLRHFRWKRVAIVLENAEMFSLRHDARIIIVLAHEEMARQIMCQAYLNNVYGQKFVWILIGWLKAGWYLERIGEDDVTCSNTDMKSVLDGHLSIKVSSYSQDFNKVNFHGVIPTETDLKLYTKMKSTYYFAGFAYDTIVYAALALNHSEKLLANMDPPRHLEDFTYQDAEMANYIKESAKGLQMHGVSGQVELSTTHDRISDLIIEQMQGKLPPTDGVKKIFVNLLQSLTIRIVTFVLSSLGILFSILCLILNAKFRNMKVIKISSPVLNAFIGIGCILFYIVLILFGLDISDVPPSLIPVYCSRVGDTRLTMAIVVMIVIDIAMVVVWLAVDDLRSVAIPSEKQITALIRNPHQVNTSTLNRDHQKQANYRGQHGGANSKSATVEALQKTLDAVGVFCLG